MAIHPIHAQPRHQRGAALITGLLIMMVMTLIGIAAMESSVIQGNLATNAQLNTVSFQTTEATLARIAGYTYLSLAKKADEKNGEGWKGESEGSASLDNQIRGSGNGGEVKVTTREQVDFCGTLPPQLSQGLSLDANQSITNNALVHYVFDLAVRTDVGNGDTPQASTTHRQRSTRLMLSKQGGGIPLCNI